MSLTQQIQAMHTASQAQTAASQALAQEVAGKMGQIDDKVNNAISQVNNNFTSKASELTIIAVDSHRKAVEDASGGRNTVIYDAQGNPNVMVVVPRFNYEDLDLTGRTLGTGTPTAFLTNGAPRSEILIGKFLASTASGGTAVVGGKRPRTSVNYDVAKELCTRKGAGWHMMSIHEWAAVSLLAMANDTQPRGNTNYGRSHENRMETGLLGGGGVPGDVDNAGYTMTGTGPATWGHDHTDHGIQDLVGNVWEWLDQMLLEDGRIVTTSDNDPARTEGQWIRHAAFLDATNDSQEGTGAAGGAPIFNTQITKRNGPAGDDSHNYPHTSISNRESATKAEGYQSIELLRRLLIEPDGGDVPGYMAARNYGLRFPIRGGSWGHGASAGLGALNLLSSRANASSSLGFRPAFFV